MGVLVGREREFSAVTTMLDKATHTPAVLIVEGEAGIGKTSLCRAALRTAHDSGFNVLATSGAAAEVSLAWSALTDLLEGIDQAALDSLSPLHQRVVRALVSGLNEPGGDERLVATAFRAALDRQCQLRPLLIVVDDAHWIDEPSRRALGFAIRRLTGPVAVIAAYRTGEAGGEDRSWMQPADPDALAQLTLTGMSLEELRMVLTLQPETATSPSTIGRIHSTSGGNPFYALELARFLAERPDNEPGSLPPSLAALVRDRIGDVDASAVEVLVTTAAALEPTIELIGAATHRSPVEIVDDLRPLERRGVLAFDGSRIRFAHPLIVSGIVADADPAIRRDAHRRLADAVDNPEQRARHLALSAPHGDADTLAALDSAAETLAARGAHSAAAELLTLAISHGGETEWRRLRCADFHFRAGALTEAETILAPSIDGLTPGFMRAVGLMLLAAVMGFRDGLTSTIDLLQQAVTESGEDRTLRAQALMLLSTARGIGGDMASSVQLAGEARADAEATGVADLRSQANAVWVAANMIYGLGLDTVALNLAREIEDPEMNAPIMFRPTTVYAQTCAWTGRLEEARAVMSEVARMCAERGNELDVVWAAEQLTMIDVGLGRYADAESTAVDALQRARHIGGRLPLIAAYTAVASAAAHQGRSEDTRTAAGFAIDGATAGDLTYVTRAPLMSLAFVQVSACEYEEALLTLKPLLASFDPAHDTEIMVGGFLPDAVEALTAVGRIEEAEPLVNALQANGERHDRPWMLAVGERCRALLLAASGELDAALGCTERAMAHHERLPMPFERARTQLLAGQLQRRRRRTQSARASLTAAAAVFADIGSSLWLERAERELARLSTGSTGSALTDTEHRIAELAAAGRSNKEIAATLFISDKTVEMHLSNTYRKLAIRSRAQLSDRLRADGQ